MKMHAAEVVLFQRLAELGFVERRNLLIDDELSRLGQDRRTAAAQPCSVFASMPDFRKA
jgi:hypothetical protein